MSHAHHMILSADKITAHSSNFSGGGGHHDVICYVAVSSSVFTSKVTSRMCISSRKHKHIDASLFDDTQLCTSLFDYVHEDVTSHHTCIY